MIRVTIGMLLTIGLAAAQPAPRVAVPSNVEVEKAQTLVRDLYKADLARKKPAEQVESARKLMKIAGETNDNPAARLVLYREAVELACRAGDLGTALESGSGIIQHFEIKPVEAELGVLETADRLRVTPRAVAEAAMEVADEAIRDDDYASATRLLKLAAVAAGRANSSALSAAVQARTRDSEALARRHAELAPARDALKSNADDAAANLKVGSFLALGKNEWNAALPMLAKGSDEKWKVAAEMELKEPIAADARTAIADRWFDLAALLEAAEAGEVRFHAYEWYARAAGDLSGLSKSRVEKRMQEIEKTPDFKSARGAGWRVLFRSAEPAIWNTDTNRGRYRFAIPVAKAPVGIRYLRIAETVKGTSVIIEMSKDRLDQTGDRDGYGWGGRNEFTYMAHHLGIYDMSTRNNTRGAIAVYGTESEGHRGWGFGNRTQLDDIQGYTWNGEPVPRMVFEIAVKAGPLTPEESKRLLKKRK